MAINYPIIETQLRLIRALQKGYVEALEAGDWQAADYRCNHLHKLCEGLHYLGQLLSKENAIPPNPVPVASRSVNGWVSTIRATNQPPSLTQSSNSGDKPAVPPSTNSDPSNYIWSGETQAPRPPIDEVW
ncbi:MAG: hypothetical protein LDL41_24305 [Coleofasciculus sp. S288]|nr:hypothetical protein [Coleofasciculus sp. S288]